MKIDIYNEQKKAAMLYDTQTKAAAAAKGSISGTVLAGAVSFTRGDKEFELFGASGYASEALSTQQKAKSFEEVADEAETLKANMKAICNKMDMGELVTMDDEGVDVNDTEVEKIVTVGEQIRIKLAAAGNERVYTGDIDEADVQAVLGNGAAALIADAFNKYNYPVTEENVTKAEEAVREVETLKVPDVQAKSYLMNNELAPTVENMYKAEFAAGGSSSKQPITDEQWEELEPQIKGMMEQAGIDVDEESLSDMKELIECGTLITLETLSNYRQIMQAADLIEGMASEDAGTVDIYREVLIDKIAAHMADGGAAGGVNLSDEPVTWQKAKEVMRILDSVTIGSLAEFLEGEGYDRSLEGLAAAEEAAEYATGEAQLNPLDYYNFPEDRLGDTDSIRALRQLEEIRLMMTFESAYILEKNGIDVHTEELSKLVMELKKLEMPTEIVYPDDELRGIFTDEDQRTDVAVETVTDGKKRTDAATEGSRDYRSIMYDLGRLKGAPCDAIGQAADSEQVSLSELEKTAFEQQRMYEAAGRTYETMATQVRPDLGDRLNRAVEASTDYVIKELDIDNTEQNRRAVRILAYNQMEVTVERLERVKEVDAAVNNIFEKMTPDIALDMLRDGVDIMDTGLDELLAEVEQRREEKERINTKKFSEFLYEMDKKGAVSGEEREQYMALYTIVNKLIKDKGNAVGQLVNQGSEATIGNLVTSYMTRNDAGINVGIAGQNNQDESRQPEHNNAKLTYYKELLSKVSELPKEAVELVTENGLPHTVNNLAAAGALYADNAYLYKEIKKAGIEADLNRFFDTMDSREMLTESYEELRESLKAAVAEARSEGRMPDVQLLRQLGSTMSVLNSMAQHNTFYLPYDTSKGTRAIKLSVVENSEAEGSFTVDMESEESGHIRINAKVEEDALTAYILQEKENEEVMQGVREALTKLGFTSVKLTSSKTQQFPPSGKGVCKKVETKKLFAAAKVFVEKFR